MKKLHKAPGGISYLCFPNLCVAKCRMKIFFSVSVDCRSYNFIHLHYFYITCSICYIYKRQFMVKKESPQAQRQIKEIKIIHNHCII